MWLRQLVVVGAVCGFWGQSQITRPDGTVDHAAIERLQRIEFFVPPPDPNAPALTKAQLKQVFHQVHSGLEGGEEENTIKNPVLRFLRGLVSLETWKNHLNFVNLFSNGMRLYDLSSIDPRVRSTMQNGIAMLMTSHATEVVWGFTSFGSGFAEGLAPLSRTWRMGMAAIAVPGLDPLCGILIATYVAVPDIMGRIIYYPRVAMVWVASQLYQHLGLRATVDFLFQHEPVKKRLEQALRSSTGSTELVEIGDKIQLSFGDEKNERLLVIRGTIHEGQFVWASVDFSPSLADELTRQTVFDQLRGFNFIARRSIREIIAAYLEHGLEKHPGFVEKVSQGADAMISADLKMPAIMTTQRREWRGNVAERVDAELNRLPARYQRAQRKLHRTCRSLLDRYSNWIESL